MSYLTSIFGENVFSEAVMRERLPEETFEKFKRILESGENLDENTAKIIASEMKDWAVEKGATHYTHWFQPMTDKTAEKHNSFIEPTGDGRVYLEFSSKQLIQGESDASSFPSGGIRATFEGRGYTVWDITSPAFVKDGTLFIPTAFFSYTGEALDKKTPLLRSMDALNKQGLRIVRLFGDEETTKVIPTVGAEQEYFLIEKWHYEQRQDLILTGRTLFGAKPPKGQELDDHYYGTLNEKVSAFMKELDEELWKVGILSKTKHNEVAPKQHEMAPIYQVTNISTDQNQLVMDILLKVANRHELVCLLHEKPFAGVSGSGKHNNWSVGNGKVNFLDPGDTPHDNALFLTFLVATISAVKKHAPLLRLSASSAGNDHRLGGNEAPPAIISMFLGSQITDIIEQIKNGALTSSSEQGFIDLGVTALPAIPKDVTDRNRTSPFAFTGNKFEFRMVGSSASIADANIVLNTILADELMKIADELEGVPNEDFHDKLSEILERLVKENYEIIFDGDGYTDEWVEEAKKRGLPLIESSVEAISYLTDKKSVELFGRQSVYNETELKARQEIMYESYAKTINIEALTMIDMAEKEIVPTILEFLKEVSESVLRVNKTGFKASVKAGKKIIVKTSKLLDEVYDALEELKDSVDKASKYDEIKAQAFCYKEEVLSKMEALRAPCDELETIVRKVDWPFVSYVGMLFDT